jgi:ABC-2 type transport system ATP-binding protein
VFSETKDRVLEEYAVVKGKNELLDADTRKEFVAVRENNFGFEALTNKAASIRRLFKQNAIIEKATLEDIMVYTVRGNA